MGGQNEAMKTKRYYQQQMGAGSAEKKMTPEEQLAYSQLEGQGMSGSPDESASAYFESLKSFGRQFIQDKSPNSYGRQASPAPTIDKNK